jgi:hypothetical protein
MIELSDVEIEAFKPGESTSFLTLSDSIQSVTANESAKEPIDSVLIELEFPNPDTGTLFQPQRVTSGDRLDFKIKLPRETTFNTRLVLMARDITDELTAGGGLRRVRIEATNFVSSVLSFRVADGAFESTDVGEVVKSLVDANAPAVGTSQIQNVGRDVTISVNGRKVLDVISNDLAPAGDAIVTQSGTDLVFKPLDDIFATDKIRLDDVHTPISVRRVDDELINRVRIDGGNDKAIDASQTTQSSTVRVTDTSRQVFQVPSRKSEFDSIDIFTDKDATAEAGIIVRVQAARNGSAVDPTDTESDIARRELAPPFISDFGFTEFSLPDHDLSPNEDPVIIVEGAGSIGHDIGTDSNGNVTFRVLFPYPLLARASNGGSVREFRRRDLRRRDEQLKSEQAVQDAAEAALRHRSQPKRRINATAATRKTFRLAPGDGVEFPSNFPVKDVTGLYLATQRRTTFNGNLIDTELTFEDATTI